MKTNKHWVYLALVGGLVACSSDGTLSPADPGYPDSGGDDGVLPGTGGAPGMGGATGTGGLPPATGGAASTGGALHGGSGGDDGAGGALAGGAGGDASAGGATVDGAGGDQGTGGALAGGAGGDEGTGGATGGGAGGDASAGGATGAGGATPGTGTCCSDGNCLCHGPAPTRLSSAAGPYRTDSYSLRGTGCIYYPTNAEPPFAAVAISDGYLGTGGCGAAQTSGWGPLYASHGIVTMIIETAGGDQPRTRGTKLLRGIAGFKAENQNGSSPLFGKLAGRYGTSGFSMGGGGTTYASSEDPSLLTSVAIMPWSPTSRGITVPTLVICGSSDTIAACRSHGQPLYNQLPASTPKMIVTVTSGHNGQPTAGSGLSGARGLAFQKVFLEGDERWKDVLQSGGATTNIQ